MKKYLTLLFFIAGSPLLAQYVNPNVKWELTSRQVSDDEFELKWTANIAPGFHLYSQFIAEDGPIPTSFTFEKSPAYKLIGKVKESGNRHEALEPVFLNMKLIWFEEKGIFTQRFKLLKEEATIKGFVSFMTCNDKLCDPPSDHNFEIKLKGKPAQSQPDPAPGTLVPGEDTSAAAVAIPQKVDSDLTKKDTASFSVFQIPELPVTPDDIRNQTYWEVFIAGLLTGFMALLFPCVWPVIPLTVSFFLKHNSSKRRGRVNALLYGFSITAIFVILGVFVSLVTNGQKLNELSTGWFFNILFFVLFFLFGLSFLGVFEIRLPSGLINRSESLSEKGGLLGIFFMAFTLVLVSFSCTLPFIGNLIMVVTQDNEFIKPLIGFTAFGLALGLPFGLFAWFPAGLKKLPKSGAWMHSLKVSFGFIEIALSLIYLSKVDMAYHWDILSRDIFLALWVILFVVLGLYLLGRIHLSPEDDVPHISVPRLLFGVVCLAFGLYMVPGLWGSPLKPLSGFLPNYSEFEINAPAMTKQETSSSRSKKYANLFESPLGLDLYFDYDDALAQAKKKKKPLFIDFTGWGCVNCRKMEKSVWPDPQVLKRLKEDYVSVSLYVDDKTRLPDSEKYFSEALDKEVVTLGDKNFDIQYSRYKMGAQPFYVLLDENGNMLTQPRGYTSDVSEYVEFLDEGLAEFKKRQLAALR